MAPSCLPQSGINPGLGDTLISHFPPGPLQGRIASATLSLMNYHEICENCHEPVRLSQELHHQAFRHGGAGMAPKARLGFNLGRVPTSRNILTSHRLSPRASDHSRENCGRNGMRTQLVLVPKNGIKTPSNCSFRGVDGNV